MQTLQTPLEKAQEKHENFIDNFHSLQLATVDRDGIPNASYAPFAVDSDKNFYVFVSGLSQHTPNLYHTGFASVMFIEDEKTAKQIFARERLTYHCKASLIERDALEWPAAEKVFEERFGQTFKHMKSLPDFRMFRLTPQKGLFVIGFGQAFSVSGKTLNELSHLGGDDSNGHSKGAHDVKRGLS